MAFTIIELLDSDPVYYIRENISSTDFSGRRLTFSNLGSPVYNEVLTLQSYLGLGTTSLFFQG